MGTRLCPFHVECRFHNSAKKTPSEAMLEMLLCSGRHEDCEIARRMRAESPVPAGAGPQ